MLTKLPNQFESIIHSCSIWREHHLQHGPVTTCINPDLLGICVQISSYIWYWKQSCPQHYPAILPSIPIM